MSLLQSRDLSSDAAHWQAIISRDPAAHFTFVYAVKTTGIYCRPTCTGRRARRANVTYYGTALLAQQAGFRPCTKCKPDDAHFIGQQDELVLKTLSLIWSNESIDAKRNNLNRLAEETNVTASHLCRTFKRKMGRTLGVYIRDFEASKTQPAYLPAPPAFTSTVASTSPEAQDSVNSSEDVSIDYDGWLLSEVKTATERVVTDFLPEPEVFTGLVVA